MAQIALAWTLARPGVSSTIIGASKIAQLRDNIAATDIQFNQLCLDRLNAVSAPPLGFSSGTCQRSGKWSSVARQLLGGPNKQESANQAKGAGDDYIAAISCR